MKTFASSNKNNNLVREPSDKQEQMIPNMSFWVNLLVANSQFLCCYEIAETSASPGSTYKARGKRILPIPLTVYQRRRRICLFPPPKAEESLYT